MQVSPVRRWRVSALMLLGFCLALPALAGAQSVSPDPTTLTVAADVGSTQQRQIVLTSIAPVSEIEVVIPQMVRGDSRAALPADAIVATPAAVTLAANDQIAIPLTFNFANAEPGAYNGTITIRYRDGETIGTQAIALAVQVKHPALAPFLTLLAGVGLASLLSIYRAQGQPRDEQLVRLNRLRAQAATDRDAMSAAWNAAFDSALTQALFLITTNRIDDARTRIDAIENMLSVWVQGRAQWTGLTKRASEARTLAGQLGSPAFAQALGATIDAAESTAIQSALQGGDTSALQGVVATQVDEVNRLAALRTRYDDAVRLRDATLADKRLTSRAPEFANRLAALRSTIDALLPGGDTATPLAQADALIAELNALPMPGTGAATLSGESTGAAPAAPFVPSAPAVLAQLAMATAKIEVPGTVTRGAAWRVRLFQFVRFAIATVFLAGTGFTQLYIANATFGASMWGDYFALLLWGFSSETSRVAITDLARNLGVPGLGNS